MKRGLRATALTALTAMTAALAGCGSQAPVGTAEAASAPAPAPAVKPVSWGDVVGAVGQELDRASEAAARADHAAAKEAVYDAYFASFEALGMETAIRENLSARRAFELEEMFASLRKSLHAADRGAYETGKAELLAALATDAAALTSDKVALP